MSDDFDDDDDDGFFDEPPPDAERPLGLVVGPRALLIFDANGEVIFDELQLIERAYRFDDYTKGGPENG